jgi:hypothetical protein
MVDSFSLQSEVSQKFALAGCNGGLPLARLLLLVGESTSERECGSSIDA